MEFYSGKPDNLAASVRDYCTGVLIRGVSAKSLKYMVPAERLELPTP